jgi:5,5'-dehydrodivanillate O-demethylase
MHRNWSVRQKGQLGPYGNKHLKVDFKEFDYGFTYHRLVEGMPDDHERWTIGRICLWPNCLGPLSHFEWRVPIDDNNTLSVGWFFVRVPKEREPYVQASIPSWEAPVADPVTGRWYSSHIMNQDFVAWVGQGTIADRTKEHLSVGDRGVILMRKRFMDDLERIERGEDPKGIIRDPKINHNIQLPIVDRNLLLDGVTMAETAADPSLNPLRGFQFLVGQPEAIRREFLEVMGFDDAQAKDLGASLLVEAGKQKTRRIWA